MTKAKDMKDMEHVTNDMIANAIKDVPDIFDALDLVDVIRRRYEHEYLKEAHKKLKTQNPFQQLHADLASRLCFMPFTKTLKRLGTRRHKNIMGSYTSASLWQKIPAQQTADEPVLTPETAPVSDHG